jgi:hypothetical protein
MEYFASMDSELPKAWERVWRGGRDVTVEPVLSWPMYPQRYFREGWRPRLHPGEVVEWRESGELPELHMIRSRSGRGLRHG